MMDHLHYTLLQWLKNILSWQLFSALLQVFGVLWLCVEISSYFSDKLSKSIKELWWLFILLGIIYAVWKCKPRNRVICKLADRDAHIAVVVGNAFNFPGVLVVGSNTTFDTEVSRQLISSSSIQGQFTEKYYEDSKQLDIELQENLNTLPYEELDGVRVGKKKRYDIGTVVKMMPRGKTAYFVAIAHMNEHGNAYGEFEYVKEALAKLWFFIGERGEKGQVVMPVIGTGFMRLRVTREEVIREIVKHG